MIVATSQLPHVLAVINAATIATLLYGYAQIREGKRDVHRRTMITAAALGVAFLVIYLYYHASAGLAKFGGEGAIRPVYFTLLATHVLMAVIAAVMAPVAIVLGLKGSFVRHKRFARLALPIWLFVSGSGLAVYAMAVHLFPYYGG